MLRRSKIIRHKACLSFVFKVNTEISFSYSLHWLSAFSKCLASVQSTSQLHICCLQIKPQTQLLLCLHRKTKDSYRGGKSSVRFLQNTDFNLPLGNYIALMFMFTHCSYYYIFCHHTSIILVIMNVPSEVSFWVRLVRSHEHVILSLHSALSVWILHEQEHLQCSHCHALELLEQSSVCRRTFGAGA